MMVSLTFGEWAEQMVPTPQQIREKNPRYQRWARKRRKGVADVAQFWETLKTGQRTAAQFMEALNRDDFPELLADVLGRELLPAYNRRPPTWAMYCKRGTAPNYRPVHRIGINGLSDGLPEVPRATNVPRRSAQEVAYEHSLKKRSVIVDIALEDLVDDNIDGFAQIPEQLAEAALWTEDIEVARVICDASGPNATYYNATNGNIIDSNAALDADSLTAAQSQLRTMKDSKGNPIRVLGTVLLVGPGLAETAARLTSSIQARSTGNGIGTT